MSKRRGKKPKTLKEKQAEYQEKLMRVLRIASVYHNIQRNKHTRRISKLALRRYEKELSKCKTKMGRKSISILINSHGKRAEKMQSYINEDSKFLIKEMKGLKFK